MDHTKVSAIKNAANGRWHEIFKAVTASLDDAIDRCPNHVPCPVAGGKDGFRLFKDSTDSGGGVSNQHGVFSNGFDLLMWVLDKDFTYVLNEIADYLQLSGNKWKGPQESKPTIKQSVNVDTKALERCRYALRKAWMNTLDLTSPEAKIARKYLHNRGLDLTKLDLYSLSKTMRFNPALELYENRQFIGKFPALVTLVSYSDGVAATVHRTYLDTNGNKLDIEVDGVKVKAKKIMSLCQGKLLTGGAIQFGQTQGEIMHVAEGIETAFSVRHVLASRRIKDEAVWSSVSSTLLAKLDPPKSIKHLFVWADRDRVKVIRGKNREAGLDAAMELAARMEERGVCVHIMYPQSDIPNDCKSVDWNDILVNEGEQAFPHYHQQIWGKAC